MQQAQRSVYIINETKTMRTFKYCKNFKLLKCGGIVVEIISMTHSLFIGAYVGFIRQSIILIAIIIGLIKYIKYEKNQKYYFIG